MLYKSRKKTKIYLSHNPYNMSNREQVLSEEAYQKYLAQESLGSAAFTRVGIQVARAGQAAETLTAPFQGALKDAMNN